jgi:hypothetical protein
VNLGIQTVFSSNVAAGSASSAPGRGSSGGPATAAFLSTYALSVSKSSTNDVRPSEDNLTKVKTTAKAAAGTGGLTANLKAAPKEEILPATPATGGAPIPLPAATASLPPATTLATLPDAAPTEFSIPVFAAPVPEGLDPGVVTPAAPSQKTVNASAQNAAATPSSPSAIVAPSQNVGVAPASSTSMNVMIGNVIPESGALAALVSSSANPQSRRESLAGGQRVASGEVSGVRTPPASGTGNGAAGLAAPRGLESASSKVQNGVAPESLFQFRLSVANTSVLSSSSSSSSSASSSASSSFSASSVSSTGTAPSLGASSGVANTGPDSSGKPITAGAEPNHSPGSINAASGTPGQDSGSSDSASGQSGAGQSGTGQSGVEQSGVERSGTEQSGDEQSFRKDLTAIGTSPAAAQPVLPQTAATAVPGDAVGQLGTSAAANPAPKSGAAAAPNSSSPAPASGESPLTPAVGPVQMAQMVSRAAQSEMRIGLTTSAFGNVEVRTQVRANEVGLAIGSERGDLRSLLANELPGLANRLQQQSLRLSQVNFHESSAFSGNSSSGENPQRRFFTQPASVPSPVTETTPETFPAAGNTEGSRSRHAGLSVLA